MNIILAILILVSLTFFRDPSENHRYLQCKKVVVVFKKTRLEVFISFKCWFPWETSSVFWCLLYVFVAKQTSVSYEVLGRLRRSGCYLGLPPSEPTDPRAWGLCGDPGGAVGGGGTWVRRWQVSTKKKKHLVVIFVVLSSVKKKCYPSLNIIWRYLLPQTNKSQEGYDWIVMLPKVPNPSRPFIWKFQWCQ